MKFLRLFQYMLLSTLRNLKAHGSLHFLTAVIVMTCFLLLSGGLLLFQNFRVFLLGGRQETRLSIYFEEGKEILSRDKIESEFCKETFVKRCEFQSSEKARERFIRNNPDLGPAVNSLEKNPFPASVEVEIQPNFRDTQALKHFSQTLRGLPGIESVDDGKGWMTKWVQILDWVDYMLKGLTLLLGLACVFIISNTVKLLVFARRDEIEIQSLVGAQVGFIQAPFLIEGVLQGWIGVAGALGFLWGGVELAKKFAFQTWETHPLQNFVFLEPHQQIQLLVFGGLVGLVGSFLAVRRFL